MATSNSYIPGLSRDDGIDFLDSVLAPLFVLASFAISQIGTLEFGEPINRGFDTVLYAASGTEITYAFIIAIGTLAIAWITNQRSWSEFDDMESLAVAIALGLTSAQALIPAVNGAVADVWYVGWFLVFVNGAAFYVLAYK